MSTNIVVPTLGESVTEATIAKWFKKVGDAVKADEPLVELETDKVTVEVPAPAAGTLTDILAKDGDTVAVGAVLGILGAAGAAPAKAAPAAAPAPAAAAPAAAGFLTPAGACSAPSAACLASPAGFLASPGACLGSPPGLVSAGLGSPAAGLAAPTPGPVSAGLGSPAAGLALSPSAGLPAPGAVPGPRPAFASGTVISCHLRRWSGYHPFTVLAAGLPCAPLAVPAPVRLPGSMMPGPG